MAGKSITGASPPRTGGRSRGKPTSPSSPIKAICCPSPLGFDVSRIDEPREERMVEDEPAGRVSGFTSSSPSSIFGDKAREEGLKSSVVVEEKAMSEEERGMDRSRTEFGLLGDGGNNNESEAPPPLLFVACVEASRNAVSAVLGLSELLVASNDENEEECPVLSLPSPAGLTSF